jgi:surface antigen-like variable number repeat protein
VRAAPVILWLLTAPAAAAEPSVAAASVREVRFTGASAVHDLCASLLDARRIAESEGRLDFAVDVTFAENGDDGEVTAWMRTGTSHLVGHITFTGHRAVNDSTLRPALLLYEGDLFDIGKLRRSLARINDTGFFERLTLADVIVAPRGDNLTADVTIPLRQRRPRWWSISGPLIPGLGSWRAAISSRLPPWGRGVFEASTYIVEFNLLGFVAPLASAFPLVLERPALSGQTLLSGFAVSPALSPRQTLAHYGRAQLVRGLHAVLNGETTEPLAVPVTRGGLTHADVLVCSPPRPRLWWLRRGAARAADVVLPALVP